MHALGQAPPAAAVRAVSDWIAASRANAVLVPEAEGYRWVWPAEPHLQRVERPVAVSAAEVLTGGDLAHLGLCDLEGGGRLYVNTTKNHTRRWCSMQLCGNVAKSRRHAARKRGRRP